MMICDYQRPVTQEYWRKGGRSVDTPFRVDEELEQVPEITGKKCLDAFTAKKGKFVHLNPNKEEDRFSLQPGDIIYPICSAAACRSQVLWKILSVYKKSITLFPPHALRRGFDPYNHQRTWSLKKEPNEEQPKKEDGYFKWTGCEKTVPFGFKEFEHLRDTKEPSPETIKELNVFHDKNYYGTNSLAEDKKNSRRVYITFAQNAHLILNRLNKQEDLSNVVVVGVDMDDVISTPLKIWNTKRRSPESYQKAAELMSSFFDFSKLQK